MIAYVKGILEEISEDNAVIDVNGFGVNVRIGASTASSLGRVGSEVKLYTFTHVREDAFLLYGFLSRDELELFKLLLSVNGVGPKGAIGILSTISGQDLRFAIAAGDFKLISRAPGIGKRTAERIVLDLRDRISSDISAGDLGGESFSDVLAAASGDMTGGDSDVRREATAALVALGYSSQESAKAVSKAMADGEFSDAGALIKAALRFML